MKRLCPEQIRVRIASFKVTSKILFNPFRPSFTRLVGEVRLGKSAVRSRFDEQACR
ncbi:MAG: hypothetical protein LBH77_08295 [Tannerella sp.]|nr:hypothetical protein [Tannerella sp.]